jgi:hypothetical protein
MVMIVYDRAAPRRNIIPPQGSNNERYAFFTANTERYAYNLFSQGILKDTPIARLCGEE